MVADFPKHGVRVDYFNELVELICGGRQNILDLTTADVCENIIKPATENDLISYCDLLQQQNHPAYGSVATVFISHAWQYKFVEVVDALLYHFRDAPDTIVSYNTSLI